MRKQPPNTRICYPDKLIGVTDNKYILSVTDNPDVLTMKPDLTIPDINIPNNNNRATIQRNLEFYLSKEQRVKRGMFINDNYNVDNLAMWVSTKRSSLIKETVSFEREVNLHKKFAASGMATPINVISKINKLTREGLINKTFAITERCAFNIDDYDYSEIADQLKSLFDWVANEGYIYTDVTHSNICEINKNTFGFSNYNNEIVYKYKGFKPNPRTKIWKKHFTIQEIISDIMEVVFLVNTLFQCHNNPNTGNICNNSDNIISRINELIEKYSNPKITLPMFSSSEKGARAEKCLLDLIGCRIPDQSPYTILINNIDAKYVYSINVNYILTASDKSKYSFDQKLKNLLSSSDATKRSVTKTISRTKLTPGHRAELSNPTRSVSKSPIMDITPAFNPNTDTKTKTKNKTKSKTKRARFKSMTRSRRSVANKSMTRKSNQN